MPFSAQHAERCITGNSYHQLGINHNGCSSKEGRTSSSEQQAKGKGQVWETHSQTIRSDNWRDFRKKCLFQCGGPAGIRTQISGFTDRCSTVELQNHLRSQAEVSKAQTLPANVARRRGAQTAAALHTKQRRSELDQDWPSYCVALQESTPLRTIGRGQVRVAQPEPPCYCLPLRVAVYCYVWFGSVKWDGADRAPGQNLALLLCV